MNQLDWEKMQESFTILEIQSNKQNWTYNPVGYALVGSTTWQSGSIPNLTSEDGVFVTFRSYSSGSDTTDFVDSNTSDMDFSIDKGTHSNFTAQEFGPDSEYDVLTEENTGPSSNMTLIDAESFEGTWPPTGWSETSMWDRESNNVYDGSWSADFDGSLFYPSGYLTSPSLNCSGASAIYIEFWWYDYYLDNDDFELEFYNGSVWDNYQDLDQLQSQNGWHHYTEKLTDSQYFISDFQIRWWAKSVSSGETGCVDFVNVAREDSTYNYELDLELQWTNTDYNQINEELCIYAGSTDSEDITVEIWNATANTWDTAFIDLITNSWNNISVSSWLTEPIFTIRFRGGLETNDATQDTWAMDAALLYVWSDEYMSEVIFIGSGNTEPWSQLNWTTSTTWSIGSVNVTLQLYDFSIGNYSTGGDGYMAYTSDSTPTSIESKNQTISSNPVHFRNATGYWKLRMRGTKNTTTQFDFSADLVEIRPTGVYEVVFSFYNGGSLTSHLVSLWISNSTHHKRYDIDVFVNSGEIWSFVGTSIILPEGSYIVKAVSERGNIAVYSEG